MLLPSALGFSPHPPVSVYGTGTLQTIAAFLDAWLTHFPTLVRSASRLWIVTRFFLCDSSFACPGIPFPGCAFHTCPHSSVLLQYRNFYLLSIGYAFQPLLRPRLTRSRSALLRKPWIFGHRASHPVLATQSSILSSCPSTAPYGTASPVRNAPLPTTLVIPELRCRVSAPDIFGAGTLDQ